MTFLSYVALTMSVLPKFSNIIFYRLAPAVSPILAAIKEITLQRNLNVSFEEVFDYDILKQTIDNRSLVVSFVHIDQNLCHTLYTQGATMVLSWEQFFQNFASLFQNINSTFQGEVALLFLPPNFTRLLEGLFRLHGFKTTIINSFAQLKELDSKQLFHIVFDQDLPGLKVHRSQLGSVREETIHYLKRLCMTNQEATIFIVKNFQQGSLFDDINSSVKDISNLLLSHEEYFIFMKTFLSHFSFHKAVQEKENLCRKFHFPYFERSSWKLLKNPKKIYTGLIEKSDILKEACYNTNIVFPLMDWQLRELLLSWFVDYSEEMKNRASFKFISGRSEKVSAALSRPDASELKLADVASKLTKLSDQKSSELPHVISKEPHEPERKAGGPK